MTPGGILLLGANSFVGKALVARLKAVFPEIYLISRSGFELPSAGNIKSYQSSLDNTYLLKKLLPRCRFVFHLASETTPGISVLQPSFEVTSNLLPSLRFLECLQAYPDVALIYISSGGAVYGDCGQGMVTESMPLAPLSYYGAGKASFEKFIHAFCRQTKGHATILRPSNFYGPGQPYRQGFGIVPTIFHHLLTGKTMQIWGDGEIVRDYLYIEDFVDFCMQQLKYYDFDSGVRAYNIGSGHGTTLNELCSLVEDISGRRILRDYRPPRSVDVKRIILDCSRIRKDFKWNVRVDLRTGLKKTWEWFCAQQREL